MSTWIILRILGTSIKTESAIQKLELSAYNKERNLRIIQQPFYTMEEINGATIFWLLSLGMVAGGLMKLFLGNDRGLGIITNIIGGMLGTLIVGILAIQVSVPGSLLLGLMGTMAILFLGNVFYMEDDAHPHEAEKHSP